MSPGAGLSAKTVILGRVTDFGQRKSSSQKERSPSSTQPTQHPACSRALPIGTPMGLCGPFGRSFSRCTVLMHFYSATPEVQAAHGPPVAGLSGPPSVLVAVTVTVLTGRSFSGHLPSLLRRSKQHTAASALRVPRSTAHRSDGSQAALRDLLPFPLLYSFGYGIILQSYAIFPTPDLQAAHGHHSTRRAAGHCPSCRWVSGGLSGGPSVRIVSFCSLSFNWRSLLVFVF